MTKFKIESIGIDTSHLTYIHDCREDFVHINIASGNTYLIRPGEGSKLVCTIKSGIGIRDIITGVLYELGRSRIDVLLIPADISIDEEDLGELLNLGIVGDIGISQPVDLKHLEEATEELKKIILPKYVSLNLCPINFNKEMMDWIQNSDMIVFGFNPFGGYINSPRVISSFTIPFLLGFSARYSDVVFLSSQDMVGTEENEKYLQGLIGRDADSIYDLDVSVDLMIKPLKTMIYSSITTDSMIIPCDNPEFLTNPEELKLEFSRPVLQKGTNIREETAEEKKCQEIVEYLGALFEKLSDEDDINYLSRFRPILVKTIKEALPDWKVELAYISPTVCILQLYRELVEKRIFRPSKVHPIRYDFLITCSEDGIEFIYLFSENTLDIN